MILPNATSLPGAPTRTGEQREYALSHAPLNLRLRHRPALNATTVSKHQRYSGPYPRSVSDIVTSEERTCAVTQGGRWGAMRRRLSNRFQFGSGGELAGLIDALGSQPGQCRSAIRMGCGYECLAIPQQKRCWCSSVTSNGSGQSSAKPSGALLPWLRPAIPR